MIFDREKIAVGGGDGFRAGRLKTAATFEFRDEVAAELVEGGEREVAVALELVVEGGELEGCVAEAAEVGGEGGGIERALGGGLEWGFRCHCSGGL